MAVITMRQMLEAGVHFGHQTRRWNPKMKRFIFGERNGIYIIDLEQTLGRVERAYEYVRDLVARGGVILFVGTKKQAQDPVRSFAEKCGMPYVNERWLGGMLTNFDTISKRVGKMLEYERMRDSGEFEAMPKKEALLLTREMEKLQRNLGGLRGMTRKPEAIFVLDTKKEHIAVTEANKLGIPVVAVVDTNVDPELVQYPIPGNDDAIRANSLLARVIADAVEEGRYIAAKRDPANAPVTRSGRAGSRLRRAAGRGPQRRRPRPGRARGPARCGPRSDAAHRAGRGACHGPCCGARCRSGRVRGAGRGAHGDPGGRARRRPGGLRRPAGESGARCGRGSDHDHRPKRPRGELIEMAFTAKDVQALRQATGAGMMDAKRALEATDGDMEVAKNWLREQGLAASAKRDDRENTQGVVALVLDDQVGALVELKCETDFVAASEHFKLEAQQLARVVAAKGEDAVGDRHDRIEDLKITLKEKIEVGRVVRLEAGPGEVIDSYLHIQGGRGVNGVLVVVAGGSQHLAHDIAVHVAFARPKYLSRDDVPADIVEAERQTLEAITRNEGKPEQAIGKIVDGRLGGFYKTIVLLDQPYAKDDKQTINQLLGPARIVHFAQVEIG